ncbi:hypothetical protein UFOVP408_27 [uncultured Caudovirales phage]|uniref:Uncharacterized protein n=1 Tax=uncultured Caudovirales phage TaxID=2100421 RepID=A0A6J5M148_9CAUD|nr:hypothetical protein UFOVP356_8 [uncultured Caudovirales phage]CAB4140458.1 hypothetical protein UFOVP408_27 [uncultured Caudovirales phage]CAB4156949.1 hypothetical protein UFOVP676_46 [uncultured Caudovirales phage]
MSDRELMRQALELLYDAQRHHYALKHNETDAFVAALRARLAEPEPEPVAVAKVVLTGDEIYAAAPPARRPLTDEELHAECDALRADAERYRWLLDEMQHQHSGPYSGWTLEMLYPGDDPEAAIDAAMTREAK